MAFLQLKSNNPKFSHLIMKNPASGMLVKRLKKGLVFGYFSKDNQQEYNCWFRDSDTESSYNFQEFDFNDYSRYTTSFIVTDFLDEYFRDTMLKNVEGDEEGYTNSICINCLRIRPKFLLAFKKHFTQYLFETEIVVGNYHKLTISTNQTLKKLLQLTNLLVILNSVSFKEFVQVDEGMVKKYANFVNNLDSPYFVRYLLKRHIIPNKSTFNQVKDILNNDRIEMIWGTNLDVRRKFIEEHQNQNVIVDVGAGEGDFLYLSKKVEHYYAIDRDENKRDILNRKIKNRGLENATVLESIDDLPEIDNAKTYIMSEVLEHNEVEEARLLLQKCLTYGSRVIITTPNREFNCNYFETDKETDEVRYIVTENQEMRHEDHKWEMNRSEFNAFAYNACSEDSSSGYIFHVTLHNLGDSVDGICPIIGMIID
jgi:precorrin-6B methylase 2